MAGEQAPEDEKEGVRTYYKRTLKTKMIRSAMVLRLHNIAESMPA